MGRPVKPPFNESGVQSVEVLSDITNIPKSTTGHDNLDMSRRGRLDALDRDIRESLTLTTADTNRAN